MNNWYPSEQQLDSPQKLRAAFKQVLDRHYQLAGQHNDLKQRVASMPLPAPASSKLGANPPATTSLLGLPVGPADVTKLADGTKLTYVAATRSFVFK